MIGRCTFARAGIEEAHVARFMQTMQNKGVNLHSVLMLRGNDIFFERYFEPFTPQTPHRMYSITKSFVSIAIGCLIDEGKLHLDDRICDFFKDKLPPEVPALLQEQTVRDMLTMRTCFAKDGWFRPDVQDRLRYYFGRKPDKPAGTVFYYDSTGSYVLGTLVERVSNMGLLEYLKTKVLDHLGGFESAQLLKTPDGTPWGDSALICTPQALMRFARFVMNYGVWDGRRLLSESYLRAATGCQTDNDVVGARHYDSCGYGYQIWRTYQDSFAFYGMGGQFAICVPDKDFIFVCTGDDQLTGKVDNPAIFDAVFDLIVDNLDGGARLPAFDLDAPLHLSVARGAAQSEFERQIHGARFDCQENAMGIRWFRLEFEAGQGCFVYENDQGEKRLPFGMGSNWFGPFPQAGYSDEYGNVHVMDDFRYRCAVSAGWVETQKLQIRVQILDRYFGLLVITLGFRDERTAGVCMSKSAEDFLGEYEGWAIARRASV